MRHYYMPVRVTNIFKSDSTQTTVRRWSNWVTHTVGENVKCTATTENSLKFLKKRNLQQSYDPATAFLDICPREMKTCTHTKACGGMFTAASCTVAEDWKEPKRPSMSEWLNKLSCTMECYLGLKGTNFPYTQLGWISRELWPMKKIQSQEVTWKKKSQELT